MGKKRIPDWNDIPTCVPLLSVVANKESFSFFLVTTSSRIPLTLYVLWITNATRQKSSRPEKIKKSSNPLKIRSLIHFIEMQRIPPFFLIIKPTFLLGQETPPLLHVTSSKVMGQLRRVEYPPQLSFWNSNSETSAYATFFLLRDIICPSYHASFTIDNDAHHPTWHTTTIIANQTRLYRPPRLSPTTLR